MSSTIYKVNKIVGHKKQKGAVYYKVHWAGYTSRHDSWEPAENLSTCTSLIQAFHEEQAGRTEAQGKKQKRQSRRFPSRRVEFSSEEEDIETTTVAVRRSQRSHTPTDFLFITKDQTTTTTVRRNPRSRKPVHYLNSTLPDHQQQALPQGTELSSEEEDVQLATTTVQKRQNVHQRTSSLPKKQGYQGAVRRSTRSRTPVERPSSDVSRNRRQNSAPPSQKIATAKPKKKAVPTGTLDKKPADMTSSISTVETKVRHRLSEITEKMRKSITESIRSDLLRRSEPPVQPAPIQSSPPMTRFRAAKMVQSQSVLKPFSTYTRSKLRSKSPQSRVVQEKETKEEKGKKSIMSSKEKKVVQGKEKKSGSVTVGRRRTTPSPARDVSAQTDHPHVTADEKEEYPSWMQLGYEEVVFALIVLALVLFAFYCYNSEAC